MTFDTRSVWEFGGDVNGILFDFFTPVAFLIDSSPFMLR